MSRADKTKTALDELRMPMLGAQILLGFQFHAPFQNAFSNLSFLQKGIEVILLCIMVGVIAVLITPSARHRIVERGEATRFQWVCHADFLLDACPICPRTRLGSRRCHEPQSRNIGGDRSRYLRGPGGAWVVVRSNPAS
ncbi:DUF6328 family protein [Rhizobium favelukesii]|nr:DUF6328 family protein [Rhizobium favelukesii]